MVHLLDRRRGRRVRRGCGFALRSPVRKGQKVIAQSGEAAGLVPSTTKGTRVLEIDRFEARSKLMRKSILTAARLHVEESERPGFRPGKWAMLTATYRNDDAWQAGQIKELMRHVRQWLKRRGIEARFLWCMELTKRGRPHYHVLIRLPRGFTIPKPDKQGWWQWGMTRIEWARNAVGYMAKYASKACADAMVTVPVGARTHGVGGLNQESKRELRWWKAAKFARDAFGESADIRKVLGGYCDRTSGLFLASPWRVFVTGAGQVFAWRENDAACTGEIHAFA